MICKAELAFFDGDCTDVGVVPELGPDDGVTGAALDPPQTSLVSILPAVH